jgi:L-lactate dehydrogenase complex protein LldG
MKEKRSKGEMLARIRSALLQPVAQPFPNVDLRGEIYARSTDPLDVQFAVAFTNLKGQFLYCEDNKDFVTQLKALTEERQWNHLFCWETRLTDVLKKFDFRKVRIGQDISMADAGITGCEALVARTGSVLVSSRLASGRSLSVFPPVHIVVAYSDQLVPDIEDGLSLLTEKYGSSLPSMIGLITGPSRTADIEKTLVLGAHGPKEIFVFLVDKA